MEAFEKKLQEYARLLIHEGVNLQPGQRIVISCPVERADFARICARLADLRRRNGHPEEAEKRYREALRVTRDLETRQPCAHLPRLAGICGNLADLLAPDERRFAEAETLYREFNL